MNYQTKIKIITVIAIVLRILWTTISLLGLFSGLLIQDHTAIVVCTILGAIMMACMIELIMCNICNPTK